MLVNRNRVSSSKKYLKGISFAHLIIASKTDILCHTDHLKVVELDMTANCYLFGKLNHLRYSAKVLKAMWGGISNAINCSGVYLVPIPQT